MAKTSLPKSLSITNLCSIKGCDGIVKARGWCGKHYHRWERHGDPDTKTTGLIADCSVAGCTERFSAKSFCKKHYRNFRVYGDPVKCLRNMGVGSTTEDRFWSRVDKVPNAHGCWEWLGPVSSNGYGIVYVDGRSVGAHRAAWYFTHSEWPYPMLRHACDNRSCVNPSHLTVGTHKENMRDLTSRDRQASKLTVPDVRRIKQQIANGARNVDLAREYDVAPNTIRSIRLGRNWKHV